MLRSDIVRKELAGIPTGERAPAAFREGLYAPERIDRVYRELLDRARTRLELGDSIVLDASWTNREHRALAQSVASQTTSDLIELHCQADAALRERRLIARASTSDASDADAVVARAMATDADPWPSAVPVDTSGTVDNALTKARVAIDRSW